MVLIIPILLILNIAIYLLFGITYKENIAAEKKQAVGDFGMIIDQIYGEMQQSQLNDKDVKNIIHNMKRYQVRHKDEKVEGDNAGFIIMREYAIDYYQRVAELYF